MSIIKDDQCVSCQDNTDTIELECQHTLCLLCGKQWFKKSSECPQCKRELSRYALSEDFKIPLDQETTLQAELSAEPPDLNLLFPIHNPFAELITHGLNIMTSGNYISPIPARLLLVEAYLSWSAQHPNETTISEDHIMITNIISGNI